MKPKKRRETAILTANEIEALLNVADRAVDSAQLDKAKQRAIRDRLMIRVGLFCGGSVSEVCNLRSENLDLKRGMLTFDSLGGLRRRSVEIPKTLIAELSSAGKGLLFRGPSGGRITPRTFQRRIFTLAKRAGIKKPVYPHLLRHTYADLVLSHGSLNAAQQAERLGIRNFDSIISHLGWGRPKGDAGETADQATEGKR